MIVTVHFSSRELLEDEKKYTFASTGKEFPMEEGKRFIYKDIVFVITDCLYDLSSFSYIIMAKDYDEYLSLGGR